MRQLDSRQLRVQLERSEAARRLQLRELERNQLAAHLGGPIRRLTRLYLDLLEATDPLRARTYDAAPHSGHPDDRPLPHQPTESRRRQLRAVETEIDRIADRAARMLGDPVDYTDPTVTCPACGRCESIARQRHRRVDEARLFLETALASGPVRQTELEAAAAKVRRPDGRSGIPWSTVRRAADRLGITPRQQGRSWWWELPGGRGGG